MECHDRQHVDDQAHLGQGDQDDQIRHTWDKVIKMIRHTLATSLLLLPQSIITLFFFFPNKHSPHRKEKLRVVGLELGPKQRVERLDTSTRSFLSRKERFKVLQLWYYPK